jgi:murein L,D-transpeptidase YafK
MIKPLSLRPGLLLLLLLLCFGPAAAQPEQLLIQALNAIQASELTRAEKLLKTLIIEEPEFKLAQMVYADVLKARTTPLSQAGMGLSNGDELKNLLTEIRARYEAGQDLINDGDKIPAVLSRLDKSYLHAIVIDLKQSRLFVFENNHDQPKRVVDYYISMGRGGSEKEKEGDLRTPLGVYFVQSYIPPDKLADKYGAGAYPINYPNAWDSFNGRTGDGIWLHGTQSGTYNRPPLASEGCVVLPNDDLIELGSYIRLGQTPVLIGNDLEWLSVDQWKKQSSQTSAIFIQWIDDWESMNTDNYLSHYSESFNNGKKNFNNWARHKRRVSKNKTYINVDVSNVSLLLHPNDDVMVATFYQDYKSDNFSGRSWKRQYWHKEKDGQWRIIFEDEIPWPAGQQLAAGTHRGS